jgi:hypothetical protein
MAIKRIANMRDHRCLKEFEKSAAGRAGAYLLKLQLAAFGGTGDTKRAANQLFQTYLVPSV